MSEEKEISKDEQGSNKTVTNYIAATSYEVKPNWGKVVNVIRATSEGFSVKQIKVK